jgi:hypothetical protein
MAELTIAEALGAGSRQTATELIINKAGLTALLADAGYTFVASDANTLDELIAAIVCAGLIKLSPESRLIDSINRNVEFRYDPTINFDSPTVGGQTFNRHTVEVAFYKAIPTPKLNPMDLR